MAEGTVGSLNVTLGLDTQPFEQGLARAEQQMQQAHRALTSSARQLAEALAAADFSKLSRGQVSLDALSRSGDQASSVLRRLAKDSSQTGEAVAAAFARMQADAQRSGQHMQHSHRRYIAAAVAAFSADSFTGAMRPALNRWQQDTAAGMQRTRSELVRTLSWIQSYVAGIRLQPLKITFDKNIQLPHFSSSGGFGAGGQVPRVGVRWYDKGGLFTSPQVIGIAEKRAEFVGAADDLKSFVRAAVHEAHGSLPVGSNAGGGSAQKVQITLHNTFAPTHMSPGEMERASRKIQQDIRRAVGGL